MNPFMINVAIWKPFNIFWFNIRVKANHFSYRKWVSHRAKCIEFMLLYKTWWSCLLHLKHLIWLKSQILLLVRRPWVFFLLLTLLGSSFIFLLSSPSLLELVLVHPHSCETLGISAKTYGFKIIQCFPFQLRMFKRDLSKSNSP